MPQFAEGVAPDPARTPSFAVRSWEQPQGADAVERDSTASSYTTDAEAPEPYRSPERDVLAGDVVPGDSALRHTPTADSPSGERERPGEATYVPYVKEVAIGLEKEKSNTSWLIPTIAAAGILLALLVGITIYLLAANPTRTPGSQLASGQDLPPQSSTPQPFVLPQQVSLPCKAPRDSSVEQAIVYTVCRSSEEQITAWRDLNTEILSGTRTGVELENNIKQIRLFQANKQYADPKLHQLIILSLTQDATTATVTTSEIWSVTTYRSVDNAIVQQTGPTTYSETYHMVNQNGKWLLDKVDIAQ